MTKSRNARATSSDATVRRVGWIGLGDQGLPMAVAVAAAGHELHVWARRPASLEPLHAALTQADAETTDDAPPASRIVAHSSITSRAACNPRPLAA